MALLASLRQSSKQQKDASPGESEWRYSLPCYDDRQFDFIVGILDCRISYDFLTRSTCALSPSALRIMAAVRRRIDAATEPSAAASQMLVAASAPSAPSERPRLSQRTPVPHFPSETAGRLDFIAQGSTPEQLFAEEPALHAESTDDVFGLSASDASHVAGAST
jgi:hypothetical protein